MTLSEIIQNYLKSNHISQRELAKRCQGVSHGYIYLLIQGINPATGRPLVPRLDKLKIVAEAMGMTLHDLLDLADDMPVEIKNKYSELKIDPVLSDSDISVIESLHTRPRLYKIFGSIIRMEDMDLEFIENLVSRIEKN